MLARTSLEAFPYLKLKSVRCCFPPRVLVLSFEVKLKILAMLLGLQTVVNISWSPHPKSPKYTKCHSSPHELGGVRTGQGV